MKEHPIIFSAPMIRAIQEGRKTQTRRIVKPQPDSGPSGRMVHLGDRSWGLSDGDLSGEWKCPYGDPGDRLWVRESFFNSRGDDSMPTYYRADQVDMFPADRGHHDGPWKPSIHMPRWASRINLEVTDIRVERLQEISAEDAWLEGVDTRSQYAELAVRLEEPPITARHYFKHLWESVNGPGAWESNPWVWVVSFQMCR